jgi:hypothetical protein
MYDSFIIAVLLGYLIVGAGLVIILRGTRGVMAALVIGWLFLPPARGINLPGIPEFTKEFSVSYAVLLGVLLSDANRLISFKPRLIDIPMFIWIITPFFSSITNGLGVYDGLSTIYFNFFVFGVPYFLGRIFIRNPDDVRTVAIWFILAGLIAVPMALWESRMSPQLNHTLYGYYASPFHMAQRLGGYRPTLFMRHGLEVGLWMATSSAVALWLWITTSKQIKIFNYPLPIFAMIVLGTTILCRSLGALILIAGTTSTAFFVRTTGLRFALITLVLVPGVYQSIRISNVWAPDQILEIIRSYDEDRASSLESRLQQELDIAQHALQKPLFGWGGFNRYRPSDDQGEVHAVDGMTTITFGKNGLVGLIAFMSLTALPSLLIIIRIKGRAITTAVWAPAIGIMLGLAIFSIDMMFNAFYSPLHIAGIGVLSTVAVQLKQWQRKMKVHHQLFVHQTHTNAQSNNSGNGASIHTESRTQRKQRRAG